MNTPMKENEAVNDPRCDFAVTYERSRLPAVRELERNVLGCDYGGTSWTTRAQADHIAESLELRPGMQLLEVGAGSGWPGLLLGSMTGCNVTLLDMPLNALNKALVPDFGLLDQDKLERLIELQKAFIDAGEGSPEEESILEEADAIFDALIQSGCQESGSRS